MDELMRHVVLGVDTHRDTHVGAVLDDLGRTQGTMAVPTTPAGSAQLLAWARSLGTMTRAGVEGTGTYGASLARHLTAAGVLVVEINRPDRSRRRRLGKSDPADAESAARAVLAGEASGQPKSQNGLVEALRAVTVARRSAVKVRTQTGNQLRSLVITAPDVLRDELMPLGLAACVRRCAGLRPVAEASLLQVVKRTLRILATRWQRVTEELAELNAMLQSLTSLAAPGLRSRYGVGPQTAATLLLTAGDNPQRLRSEAALARVAASAHSKPLPGDRAAPAQSGWRSSSQQRPVDHSADAHARRCANAGVCRETNPARSYSP